MRGHAFLAIGITLEGQKEILGHHLYYRSESLETWKVFLLDLKNRCLILVKIYILADRLQRSTGLKPNGRLKGEEPYSSEPNGPGWNGRKPPPSF